MRKLWEGLRSSDGLVVVAMVYTGLVLTVLEYFFLPSTVQLRIGRPDRISLQAGLTWAIATTVAFLVGPMLIVRLLHRQPLSSVGFNWRGLGRHVLLYLGLYLLVLPFLFFAAARGDFVRQYPFVWEARRDWSTFLAWEAGYLVQFFAVEAFFRGYVLFTLARRMGWNAIFVVMVPYCMIHYHKPFLEACSAIFAGIVLGALALRLRSFYGGVVLHCLVALTMDLLGAQASGLF